MPHIRPVHRYVTLLAVVALAINAARSVSAGDDLSPETKAIISKLKDDTKSKTPSVRASAYKSMGELGKKGHTLRRTLCEGMLDLNATVRIAATDALKQVDEDIHKLALSIMIDKSLTKIREAEKMGKHAEPVTPLILSYASAKSPLASGSLQATGARQARTELMASVKTLAAIAPDDPGVNKAIVSMLSNPVAELRECAVRNLASLKHRKLGLSGTLAIATNARDEKDARVVAVRLVPDLVDENTKPSARKVIEALRFDNEPTVRDAVNESLKKLN